MHVEHIVIFLNVLTYLVETYVSVSTQKYAYLCILSSKIEHTYAAVLMFRIKMSLCIVFMQKYAHICTVELKF